MPAPDLEDEAAKQAHTSNRFFSSTAYSDFTRLKPLTNDTLPLTREPCSKDIVSMLK